MISRPLVTYILTAARRDKLVWTFILMTILGASTSVFLGANALVERDQFALVFAAGTLRLFGVMSIVLFICFHMRRAFENKEVEFLLSRPLSRTTFLFSHASAFSLIAICAAIIVMTPLFYTGVPHLQGLMLWGSSITIEYIIMATTALFFSMTLSSAAASALATFSFYALARIIGMLIGIAAPETPVLHFLSKVLDIISIVIPRLDLMGQTSWLVYGVNGADSLALTQHASSYAQTMLQTLGAAGFICIQGAVFTALLLAAASFDFSRRRF